MTVSATALRDLHPEELPADEAETAWQLKERFERSILDRDQLADLPQPQPLIDDTLDRRTVALLTGYWGTGKSFLALDWAACVATEKRWQGRGIDPSAGSVLYVAAEGASGLHQRLSAWEYAWRRKIPFDMFLVYPRPVNLLNHDDMRSLRLWCSSEQPSLVVLDTLARCMVGLEENSARDMGAVVDSLYSLRDATHGGTVLGVHHTGKDRVTSRGSSALEAGVDTVYLVEGENGRVNLKRTKRKDGPTDDVLALKLDPVDEHDSVVVVSARGADKIISAQTVLSAFMSAFETTGCSKAELRGVAAMPPASFARGLNALVSDGTLRNTGTSQRPFYVLAQEA